MVISGVNTVTYNGDGITTAWPYTFPVTDDSEIRVQLNNADGTAVIIESDYYVDLVNSTVYYPGYAPGSEPPEADQPPKVQEGQTITVYREIPMTQEADLGEKWPFEVIEKGLDKLTMIAQQIYSYTNRKLDSALASMFQLAGIVTDSGKLQHITDQYNAIDANAAAAAESADDAAASATAAANSATAASTSATNASNSASSAQTTATALTNFLETKETLTAPAVDPTLTISGAAADAKVVGDKMGDVATLKTDVKTSVVGGVNSLLTTGKNLFTPSTATKDMYVITTNGALSPLNGTYASDFITVEPNTDYTISIPNANNQTRYAFYDATYTYISGDKTATSVSSVTITSPVNARFLRFSNYTSGMYGWQVEQGSSATSYEKHYLNVLDNFVWSDGLKNRVSETIAESVIEPKNASFFYVSGNIVNPDAWIDGEYVDQTNGNFRSSANHHRTGYLVIEAGEDYCFLYYNKTTAADIRYAFYREDKVYISGALVSVPTDGLVISAPANARYVVTSNSSKTFPFMIKKSSVKIPFESYDNTYVLPKYIKPEAEDIVVNLPDKVYALEGFELNIYFENIVEQWEKYQWDVNCDVGAQYARGFKITPVAADVGTHTLSITIKSANTTKTVQTNLIVQSISAGSGETKSIIILGDSTTANGIAVTKINENFTGDVMGVETRGTQGTAPNNHEGRSGWKLSDYFTKEYIVYPPGDSRGTIYNKFYNPVTQTFDASYYFANSGVSVPDWFIVNMGINDLFGYNTDDALEPAIDQCIAYVDDIIESIADVSSNINIGICCTIPPNHSQDAFGKAYACGQNRDRYKRNNLLYVKRLIEEYSNREAENIYLIPIHTNLDTVYNMGMEATPVNARNATTYQSPIANGGVHPVESGYWQIADVYTAFLKAQA